MALGLFVSIVLTIRCLSVLDNMKKILTQLGYTLQERPLSFANKSIIPELKRDRISIFEETFEPYNL